MITDFEIIAAQLHHLLDALERHEDATDIEETLIVGETRIRQAVATLLENDLGLIMAWTCDGAEPPDRRLRAAYLVVMIAEQGVLPTLATPHGIDAFAVLLHVALVGEEPEPRDVVDDLTAPVPSQAHFALSAVAHLAGALVVRPHPAGGPRARAAAETIANARAVAAIMDFLDSRRTPLGKTLYRALATDELATHLAADADGARLLRLLQHRVDV